MNNYGNSFLGTLPSATKNLLIITVLVWLAQLLMPRYGVELMRWFALFYPASPFFLPFQPITYMFMHGGWMHLFFNMFALFMLGSVLNQVWGTKRFLLFYFITGIGAGLIHLLVIFIRIQIIQADVSTDMMEQLQAIHSIRALINTPTVGASGAIFGILLAFGMLFPNAPLYIMFIPIPIKAKYFVVGYGLMELVFGVSGVQTGIAHFAHLGGMLFGLILILYWRKTDKNRNYYEQYY